MFRTLSALLLSLTGAANAQDRLPITIAAEARQKAIRTLDVRFEIERIDEIFSTQPEQPPTTRSVGRSPANRFVLDGDKVFLEYTELVPNGNAFVTRVAFDGTHVRQYDQPVPGAIVRQNAAGKVRRTNEVGNVLGGGILPLVWALRGVNPRYNFLPLHGDNWAPDKPLLRVYGSRLDGYKHRDGPPSNLLRLWTDPSRDHSIVLIQGDSDGIRFDVSPAFHAESGQWLPEKWIVGGTRKARAGLQVTATYTVTSMEVNRPIPDDTFALTFPAGMPVVDMDTMESFIAAESGKLVPVQAPPTKFPVVKTEEEPKPKDRTGLIVVSAVAIGLLAVLVVVRFRHRAA